MLLSLELLLGVFNIDLLDLEFNSPKLYYVVFFQHILLLCISVADIAHNEIDFLKGVIWILQLLSRLRILLVNVLGHELFPLCFVHFVPTLNFCRLH